ncbi:hypothetical protein FOZ61_005480 [Perkinsus olseni]|uniref:Peptidase A1 domain-containing protein n=1 Tax=Perkinsus olseni TaxID=32597 RepID=A0A7J6LID7_PEROL|nr:hypothetical protein FOZ61_005480 [Perkinsus olseni]KAF4663424.1 hypothetical protein FOL46_004779 [Perkinsus olseni]
MPQLINSWNILASIILLAANGQIMRLLTHYADSPPYGFGLFHTLANGRGQRTTALVDTGSDFFFFVWKDWYEAATKRSCSTIAAGCFKCEGPCAPKQPIKQGEYEDGVKIKVFQHKEKIKVGQTYVNDLVFGLIFDQAPPPTQESPISILGLAPDEGDPNFPSLMKQLRAKGFIGSSIFALYLFPSSLPLLDGGLLLGGGDPSLHMNPMHFTELRTGDGYYMVKLGTLQVGDAHKTIGINEDVTLDTGTNFLYVSKLYYDTVIKDIKAQANKAARKTVPITFDSGRDVWTFPCQYLTVMPPLAFGLSAKGTVPLTMTYMNYARNDEGYCHFIIKKEDDNSWTFPDRMLIGNYFEFQPDQRRVGIARLAGNRE